MRILGISGSLRRDSYNAKLLAAAAGLVPAGVELHVWDGLKAVPPFDEDDEAGPVPTSVAHLREALASADAVVIATPEYNGSVPGVLKNALDWVSRPHATNPLRNKPVLVVGASTGRFGAAWAQADLRRILGTIGARVVEGGVAVPQAHEQCDDDDGLEDAELVAALAEALAGLAETVQARQLVAA
jgi:chromate reductase, NAD(P)H dehydrogenase (quinone)